VGDCGRIGGHRRGENSFCRATHCQRGNSLRGGVVACIEGEQMQGEDGRRERGRTSGKY